MTTATHPFESLMDITARPPNVFVRGEGSWLWDDRGRRYLDFVQGWAVNCLGHAPPVIADALAAQAKQLLSPSPAFYNAPSLGACGGSGRAKLFRSGVLRQFRRRSQRRRDQARA